MRELGGCLDLTIADTSKLLIRVHKDNVGALTLGNLEHHRMTFRLKHYAITYHWFRTQIGPRRVQLTKICTTEQLGDMFTEGLGRVTFQRLRAKLMGW